MYEERIRTAPCLALLAVFTLSADGIEVAIKFLRGTIALLGLRVNGVFRIAALSPRRTFKNESFDFFHLFLDDSQNWMELVRFL